MSPQIRHFCAWLDSFNERIALRDLVDGLSALKVGLGDVRDYVRFGADHYQRNLYRTGPAYHILVLCWRPGQRSPIHDHRGSTCAVRVLRGVATESLFAQTHSGLVYPTSTRRLAEGTVCGSQDADIHQMSNLEPIAHDLVTLHVYSPPLLVMGQYSLTDSTTSEFQDPVFELSYGAGI